VTVRATDPLTQAGLTSYLKSHSTVEVVGADDEADVQVFATAQVTADAVTELKEAAAKSSVPRVLVTNKLDQTHMGHVAECHVVAVLPRTAALGPRLVDSVVAAAERKAALSRDLLVELLKQTNDPHRYQPVTPRMTETELSGREREVLRLMAEGWATTEIANRLCYSERTVKNVIYGLTNRLNLRNRPHAVAFAVRAGVI
jgi:DNA-binding NarL/FixJ family response regulator